ncbi:hypothetical protein Tco_1034738, partial [Tanacetum coccineum]
MYAVPSSLVLDDSNILTDRSLDQLSPPQEVQKKRKNQRDFLGLRKYATLIKIDVIGAAVAILRTRVEVVQWIEGRSLEAEAKLRVVDANITKGSRKTLEIIRKLYEIEENRSLMREHFEEADILARTLRLEITKSKEKLNTREQLHLFQLTQAYMDGGLLGSLLVDKMRQQ